MPEETEYEKQRAARIARNRAMMQQMQVPQLAEQLGTAGNRTDPPRKRRQGVSPRPPAATAHPRRSSRSTAAQTRQKLRQYHAQDVQPDSAAGGSQEDHQGLSVGRGGLSGDSEGGNSQSQEYQPEGGSSRSEEDSHASDSAASEDSRSGHGRRSRQQQPRARSHPTGAAPEQPGPAGGAWLGEGAVAEEDWELQQALALSLQDMQGAGGAGQGPSPPGPGPPSPLHPPRSQLAAHPDAQQKVQRPREAVGQQAQQAQQQQQGPGTGAKSQDGEAGGGAGNVGVGGTRGAAAAAVKPEDRATAAAVAAATAPLGFVARARWRKRREQQETAGGAGRGGSMERGAGGTAGPEGGLPEGRGSGSGTEGKGAEKKRRGKKLPPYTPSPQEVQQCYQLLAAQGVERDAGQAIIKVAAMLGQEISEQGMADMLLLAADRVEGVRPGLAEGGGLQLGDFQKIAQHFRVG